ncbi:MAG: hypothetical protein EBX90_11150, partial [Betaproteobacteria bacterium]|nr:hypothetical protein [Betaproteobacteria bacterium]
MYQHTFYIPAHFANKDDDAIVKLLQSHPLGVLVTQGPQGLAS